MQISPVHCTKAPRFDKVKPEMLSISLLHFNWAYWKALILHATLSWSQASALPCKHLLPLQAGTRKDFVTLCPPNKGLRT